MSMRTIRRSFIRGYRQQSQVTPELGARVLRLILAVCLGIDFAAGHPLWLTLGLIATITAVFVRGAREIRREAAEPSPGTEGPSDGE
jgi:hypothetical protein